MFLIFSIIFQLLQGRGRGGGGAVRDALCVLGHEAGLHLNIIGANYGRFSIAICNKHGNTDWSVKEDPGAKTLIDSRACGDEGAIDVSDEDDVDNDEDITRDPVAKNEQEDRKNC